MKPTLQIASQGTHSDETCSSVDVWNLIQTGGETVLSVQCGQALRKGVSQGHS